MKPFGVVLLAAGGSSRMGRAKALLPYLGRTLIEHAARVALGSGASEVVVVLGAEAEVVREKLNGLHLNGLKLRIVINPDWQEGMGSSIRVGIGALSSEVESAVIALGDQPRITADHLHILASHLTEAVPIVASLYDGILGAPCAFARAEFARLLELKGDGGARGFVRRGDDPVATITFAEANVDIDTPQEYEALLAAEASETPSEPVARRDDPRGPPSGPDRSPA